MTGLFGKPKLCTNLKSLVSAIAEILKGNLRFLGTPLVKDHAHLFLMGLVKLHPYASFEVATISRCIYIEGKPHIKELL